MRVCFFIRRKAAERQIDGMLLACAHCNIYMLADEWQLSALLGIGRTIDVNRRYKPTRLLAKLLYLDRFFSHFHLLTGLFAMLTTTVFCQSDFSLAKQLSTRLILDLSLSGVLHTRIDVT